MYHLFNLLDIQIPAVVGEVCRKQADHDGHARQHQGVRFKAPAPEELTGIKPTEGGQKLEPTQFLMHSCKNTDKVEPQNQPYRHRPYPAGRF